MGRRSALRTGNYAVHAVDSGDRVGRRDPARDGRAAAMLRRRQLSKGKQALNGAPPFIVLRGGAG